MLRGIQSRSLTKPSLVIAGLSSTRVHPAHVPSPSLDGRCYGPKSALFPHPSIRSTLKLQPGRRVLPTVQRAAAPTGNSGPEEVEEPARKNLERAAAACRRYGWLSFWVQLVLSTVSAIILLFSVAFTSQNGPGFSLYLTLFGVVASFFSTFWAFGYTRLARALRASLMAGPDSKAKRIRKSDVLDQIERGAWINIAGLFATLVGLQATVGLLVAKTLTNATANPFLSGGAGSYSPVLALDVFLVQASTNTVLSHFVSLLTSLWLLKVLSRNPPMRRVATAAA